MRPRLSIAGGLLFIALSMPATASAQTFAYVVNSISNSISGFAMDPVTGELSALVGSPFAATSESNSIAIAGSGLQRFAYVTNENGASVGAYRIDATTGALTQLAGSPFASGMAPNSATVHPSGQFLYVPCEGDQTVWVYRIDATTGGLSVVGTFAISADTDAGTPIGRTDAIAITPAGTFAYVTSNGSPGQLAAFQVNLTTGALTEIGLYPTGVSADALVITPTGKFLYAANYGDSNITAYAINATTGALTPLAGSPFTTGGGRPDHLTLDPAGRFLYVADDSVVEGVVGFTIDATSGALTSIIADPIDGGTNFSAGSQPSGVAIDPSGKFLFVANEGSASVSVFTIDAATGRITNVPVRGDGDGGTGSPFATGNEPGKIAIVNFTPPPDMSVPDLSASTPADMSASASHDLAMTGMPGTGKGGCSCDLGGPATPPVAAVMLLLAGLYLARRRRA